MASGDAPANCATFDMASDIGIPRSARNGGETEAALAEYILQAGSFQPVHLRLGVVLLHAATAASSSAARASLSVFFEPKESFISRVRCDGLVSYTLVRAIR